MKPKFKVGDRVRALNTAPYAITTNGWKGRVTRVNGEWTIYVKLIQDFADPSVAYDDQDYGYEVEARFFRRSCKGAGT